MALRAAFYTIWSQVIADIIIIHEAKDKTMTGIALEKMILLNNYSIQRMHGKLLSPNIKMKEWSTDS